MFTVIMPDSRLMERFSEYQPLMENFFRRGDLALCPWTVGESGYPELPDLDEIVPASGSWRTLILTDSAVPSKQNPFDFSSEKDPPAMPLPVLTRKLCGPLRDKGSCNEVFDSGKNRPVELILLSTRYRRVSAAENAGRNIPAGPPSEFWKTCGYAWQSRFLVFDVHWDKERIPDKDLFCFWMAALTISLSEISSGALQAFSLYQLQLQTDEKALAQTMAAKCAEFLSVRDALLMRRQKHRRLYPKELPVLEMPVPVIQDVSDASGLTAELAVSLFTDGDVNETEEWNSASGAAIAAAERISRPPRRRVEDAALRARELGKGEDLIVSCLSPRQREDLLEETLRHESDMICRCAPDSAVSHQLEAMKKSDTEVRKELRCRVRKSDAEIAIAAAAGLFLLGMIPWLIHSILNSLSLVTALSFAGIGTLILLSVGWFGLRRLRRPLKEKVAAFNLKSAALLDAAERRNAQISESLTAACAALRGWQVLDRLEQIEREEERTLMQCDRHLQALEHAYGRFSGWAALFGHRVRDLMEPAGYVSFDPEVLPGINPLYRLQPDGSPVSVRDGDSFRAPYKFISGFRFHREEVVDE
ncbi:MAG: hypothetical protein IJD13_04130 [Oscillospiraceae bacterium]|nr:hypothetical protein [Oscillospiraceae bacterium]